MGGNASPLPMPRPCVGIWEALEEGRHWNREGIGQREALEEREALEMWEEASD
jgi:hypothetical protein